MTLTCLKNTLCLHYVYNMYFENKMKPIEPSKTDHITHKPMPKTFAEVKDIAIHDITAALADLDKRIKKLKKSYDANKNKYNTAFSAAQTLKNNLDTNIDNYQKGKIDEFQLYGLSKLQIKQAETTLAHFEGGWRRGLKALAQAFNHFFSWMGLATRSFENELANFRKKTAQLNALITKRDKKELTVSEWVGLNRESQDIVSACYKLDPHSLQQAAPEQVSQLIQTDPSAIVYALKAFSENERIITTAYSVDPTSIKQASPQKIIELMTNGKISLEHAIKAFPHDESVIAAAHALDPASIKYASLKMITALINKNILSAVEAFIAFPKDQSIILAAYHHDPLSIKDMTPEQIAELIDIGMITPTDAVKAFPSNEFIIKHAANNQAPTWIETQEKLLDLIHSRAIDPCEAVKQCNKNLTIIKAAYDMDPTSIKHADRDAINHLGVRGQIQESDVLQAFSKQSPPYGTLFLNRERFSAAMANKDWPRVIEICSQFWFEIPAQATIEKVAEQLMENINTSNLSGKDKSWVDLYEFQKALKTEDYKVTYGPLNKSPETTQLEELYRKFIKEELFDIRTIAGDDYFIFSDGTKFNWTKIRANAELQHIELAQPDFDAYKAYNLSSNHYQEAKSSLDEDREDTYRTKLYTDPVSGKPLYRPDPPISFEEMQAINIYTGGFYTAMNGLMRDERHRFDYRTANHDYIRAALIHSVMAASGLSKVPMTNIQTGYRGTDYDDAAQQQRIATVAKQGIIKIDGFISTSIERDAAFIHKPVIYTVTQLRGAYIAPISKIKNEKEYLIPQTQIQLTNYAFKDGKHLFDGHLVSELGTDKKTDFEPVHIKLNNIALRYANPLQVIALINTGEISPKLAIEHCPDNKDIILAALQKDPDILTEAIIKQIATTIWVELINEKKIKGTDVIAVFPNNDNILSAAYTQDPTLIRLALPAKMIQLMSANKLNPNLVVEAFPQDSNLIYGAYLRDPSSIKYADASLILTFVTYDNITKKHAIEAFPNNEEIVSFCCDKNPKLIKEVSTTMLKQLLSTGMIRGATAIKAHPDDERIIGAAYAIEPSVISYASPATIMELMVKGIISPEHAVQAFQDNETIISEAYIRDPSSIKYASAAKILKLVLKGSLAPDDAVQAFPRDNNIIAASCQTDPNIIKSIPIPQLVELIHEGKIQLAEAKKAFPTNENVIYAAYKKDPDSIKDTPVDIVAALIRSGKLFPEDAIKAFPSNEVIIKQVAMHRGPILIESQDVLITLISSGTVDPHEAVAQYSKNIAIIQAAYQKDPSCIKQADREVINQLGKAGVVKIEHVLNAFSKTEPTPLDIAEKQAQFTAAVASKDWATVHAICNTFWFEKPAEATIEHLSKTLRDTQRWDDLYSLAQASKKENYVLTNGPLMKSTATTQLEELAKKMMVEASYEITNIAGDDYFIFKDGSQFNWTQIRANADLQHIDLSPADIHAYQQFYATHTFETRCPLSKTNEDIYRTQLYTDPHSHQALFRPEPAICFEEMQAIYIYTSDFYKKINGLMRDDTGDFDYRTANHDTLRCALVNAVMVASGLRKVPTTHIPVSYRGANMGTDTKHQQRIQAAAKQDVIELDGFVSSSIEKNAAFTHKPIIYTLTQLRGAYIAPISDEPYEREYLIPQTHVQLTSYQFEGGKHLFDARLVSELGAKRPGFEASFFSLTGTPLKYADPEQVIILLNKGDISPTEAVKAFPENKDVVLAAYHIDNTTLYHASDAIIAAWEHPVEPSPKHSSPASAEGPDKKAIIDHKLHGIQLDFLGRHAPNEALIKALFMSVSKTTRMLSMKTYSKSTEDATYMINAIKANPALCEVFGIDFHKPDAQKIVDIRQLMRKALADKPIFDVKGIGGPTP